VGFENARVFWTRHVYSIVFPWFPWWNAHFWWLVPQFNWVPLKNPLVYHHGARLKKATLKYSISHDPNIQHPISMVTKKMWKFPTSTIVSFRWCFILGEKGSNILLSSIVFGQTHSHISVHWYIQCWPIPQPYVPLSYMGWMRVIHGNLYDGYIVCMWILYRYIVYTYMQKSLQKSNGLMTKNQVLGISKFWPWHMFVITVPVYRTTFRRRPLQKSNFGH